MENTKICVNCGARMHWNPLSQRWGCNICGNSIDFMEDKLGQTRFPRM